MKKTRHDLNDYKMDPKLALMLCVGKAEVHPHIKEQVGTEITSGSKGFCSKY